METVEKKNNVSILADNLQVQMKEQGQDVVDQSLNDVNLIRDQIQDTGNIRGIKKLRTNDFLEPSSLSGISLRILSMDNDDDSTRNREHIDTISTLWKRSPNAKWGELDLEGGTGKELKWKTYVMRDHNAYNSLLTLVVQMKLRSRDAHLQSYSMSFFKLTRTGSGICK